MQIIVGLLIFPYFLCNARLRIKGDLSDEHDRIHNFGGG